MRKRFPTMLIASLAVHGTLFAALLVLAGRAPSRTFTTLTRVIDLQLDAPRRVEPPTPAPQRPDTPRPVAPPALPGAHMLPHARTQIDRPSRATNVDTNPGTTMTTNDTNTPGGEVNNPPTNPNPPANTQRPNLSAADLFANISNDATAAAQAGTIDLGPTSPTRTGRNLFMRERTGSREDQIRENASATITQQLADSNHMVMAGTGENARIVSRRAFESFADLTETVPNVGSAVMRAPIFRVPAGQRTAPAGERAAGDALDNAHSSFSMMNLAGSAIPERSYHLLRADVEVDQGPTGQIVATRIIRSSNVPALDRHAERAIRDAIPSGSRVVMPRGRRSHWSFEVSDAAGGPGEALFGGNEGWNVLPNSSNGVRVRARVRMFRSAPLPGSSGS